jgi:hypothetical protein
MYLGDRSFGDEEDTLYASRLHHCSLELWHFTLRQTGAYSVYSVKRVNVNYGFSRYLVCFWLQRWYPCRLHRIECKGYLNDKESKKIGPDLPSLTASIYAQEAAQNPTYTHPSLYTNMYRHQ